ncbi:MAG: hypothetical protein AAGJ73_13535 [Pseudomonadota bacterium]
MFRLAILVAIVPLLAACATRSGISTQLPDAPERTAILETLDAFFLALAAGDADTIEQMQSPDSITVTANPETDRPIRYSRGADLVANMRAGEIPPVVEPYWEPIVLQRKSLAVVWTPYQVSIDNQLIHCGVDVFNLSNHGGAWKIDAVGWTAEPSSCEELWPEDKSVFRPDFP